MKHFRDLVLSTREPALHNVLWIEPKKDEETGKYIWGEYLVKMFEDGWKILFGGGGTSSNGLGFRVVNTLPNGDEIVQLYDTRDPDNPKKAYPITKATNVYLSNTVDVETAINNINAQLRNITSSVRKAVFAADDMIDGWEVSKAGKIFWVYDHNSTLHTDGYFSGEPFLRKYTTNSSYTRETLYLSDVVMAIDDEVSSMRDTRMWYVNSISSNEAQLLSVVDYKDLIQLRNSLESTYIQDIQIDGVSVVNQAGTPKTASIRDDVRPVYMINYANLETYYPGNSKKDKTFFFKQDENNRGDLVRYTSSTEYEEIPLKEGDLLYNLDANFDFIEKGLYIVIKEGNYPQTVLLIPNEPYVSDMIYQSLTDAIENLGNVFIDFTASNPVTSSSGVRKWDVSTTATVEEIESSFNLGKNVYARLSGIENADHDLVPALLPLRLCNNGFTLFSAYGYNKGYELDGHGTIPVIWDLREIPIQTKLAFDNVPTQNSNNVVKSSGIYTALQGKVDSSDLNNYVLKSVYNARMEVTPKFHRAEFLDSADEYVEGTNYITDDTTHFIDDGGNPSASGCFDSLWWAVYDCNNNAVIAGVPKLILRGGNVACYCWSDRMASQTDVNLATQIILKFFDGTDVITYDIRRITDDPTYGTYLTVDKTTQSVTLT